MFVDLCRVLNASVGDAFSAYAFAPEMTIGTTSHLLLNNVTSLTHIQAVQELPDILVSHSADLLDVGGGLGNGFEAVASELQLILDTL